MAKKMPSFYLLWNISPYYENNNKEMFTTDKGETVEMLRKMIISFVTAILLFSTINIPLAMAMEVDLTPNAKSAILIDQDTGSILFDKNSHDRLPPASITKIMTLLLIMEALDNGKITYKDMVQISERAASMGGSQIFLEPGEKMSVEDLIKGIALASGNDASVAMAEYIAGSEEVFVEMMNKKVEELGLKDTHFVNTNGLPANNHYTSAHDIAVMSRELLKHEDITKYTGMYQDYLRKDSPKPFWLVNTNRLVRFYDGVDGLKTGYTNEAKFCLSATAKKGTLRVVAVVMGEPNTKTRNSEVSQLLDYAFSQYKNEILYKKGEIVTNIDVGKGKEEKLDLIAPSQISLLMKKEQKQEDFEQILKIKGDVIAPITKGDILGELQTVQDGRLIQTIPLVASKDIAKANLWDMLKITTKHFLFVKKLF